MVLVMCCHTMQGKQCTYVSMLPDDVPGVFNSVEEMGGTVDVCSLKEVCIICVCEDTGSHLLNFNLELLFEIEN